MTADALRTKRVSIAAAAVGVGGVITAIVLSLDSPAWHDAGLASILALFGIAIAIGEFWSLAATGFRESAPTATAAAFGLAFVVELSPGYRVPYGGQVVVAVAGTAMAIGVLARYLTRRLVHPGNVLGRFVAVVIVVVLYREVHLSQVAGLAPADDGLDPWQAALLMLGIAAVGLLGDVLVTTSLRLLPGRRSWRTALADELRQTFALSSALAVTGVLIAQAARPLGVAALPLFLVPLVLSQFAFRRYVAIRATYGQSIRTLARLTDLAGYTPAGHSERVAELSVQLGRELGLVGRELLDLEYAALLHDIGQVALIEPIPGGATVLAAPADQRRIESDTVDIVRETGVLDDVARILEHQTTPYRQVRELNEEIPLTSRIIKVVNAYEDLTGGARTDWARERALERIYLGLGYEYDPRVVDALLRVLPAPTARQRRDT